MTISYRMMLEFFEFCQNCEHIKHFNVCWSYVTFLGLFWAPWSGLAMFGAMSWCVGRPGIEVSEYMEKVAFSGFLGLPQLKKQILKFSIDMKSYDMEMGRELHGAS